MSEHEQETRELENMMERALAVAIAHSSSLIEAWGRNAAKRTRQQTEQQGWAPTREDGTVGDEIATDAATTQRQARTELAVAQQDANFWMNASPDELAQKIRTDHGIEPTRIGDRDHDRHWAERAKGAEVVGLLSVADRYADQSVVAAAVRDNIGDLIRDYGLDPDELMRIAPEAAAERLTQSRAEFWAPTQPPTHAADGRDATDRDGAHVVSLLDRAQAADRESDYASDTADVATDRAETIAATGTDGPDPQSRAQRIAGRSTTPAGKAAATAARDHPSNPRAATAAAGNKHTKARRTSGVSSDRERGRGM